MRNRIAAIAGAVGLTLWAVCTSMADEHALHPRPMEEMQGDCSNYQWDMSEEFRLWETEASHVAASATADEAPAIGLATRYTVTLHPHDSVTFVATPEKDRGGEDRFSGLLKLEIPEDGLYRISASSGVWIDAVVDGKVVKSTSFEMQTKCNTVFKSVAYRLSGGNTALLQFNGSRSGTVDIAITMPHEH
ncbi:MAG: hypothetical protein KF895_04210 [Parvibaculum sp.]|nr:hypothetical protein [Parvibaculum sp.]